MFEDRKDAGIQLGKALRRFEKDQPLVIGIPRGGVETAYYCAKELGAEMVPVISRKLGYPGNPEFAMGAIAEDGSYYLSGLAKSRVGAEELNLAIRREKEEIQRRVALLRNGKPLPSFEGRTLLVVDDGIATGATLFATIELCRKQHPKKLVVAAPISGKEAARELHNLADEVVILTKPENFSAVSQGYQDFSNLNDAETLEFIRLQELEHKSKP
jgi:predicted phosphoribosyltransferase